MYTFVSEASFHEQLINGVRELNNVNEFCRADMPVNTLRVPHYYKSTKWVKLWLCEHLFDIIFVLGLQ